MGIPGLIPFLKKASRPAHVREYSGSTVAVDASCWLHRGAFACADKLALGQKTDGYVAYCMRYVSMLQAHKIHPIMVFDGRSLPSKAGTDRKRKDSRERNYQQGQQFLTEGNKTKARECFQKAISITFDMITEVITACRTRGVDCIIAPYESDAQLAFFSMKGIASLVVTEDSDLLLFGCSSVLFKLELNGNGVLIEQSKLHLALDQKADAFTFAKFRHMGILSGCDYLPSLPGIGLIRAKKFVTRTSSPDVRTALKKLPWQLGMHQLQVPKEYQDDFIKADNTFLYQLVYDPRARSLIPLTPYPDDISPDKLNYCGQYVDSMTAFQMALGNLNVRTMEKVADFDPDMMSGPSIWKSDSQPKVVTPKPHFQTATTRGKEVQVTVPLQLPAATGASDLVETYGKRKWRGSHMKGSRSVNAASLSPVSGLARVSLSDRGDKAKGFEKVNPFFKSVESEMKNNDSPNLRDSKTKMQNLFEEDTVDDTASTSQLTAELGCKPKANKTSNPFAKPDKTPSPVKSPERFSALHKFNQLRKKTVVDLSNVIESQYFYRSETNQSNKSPVKVSPNKENEDDDLSSSSVVHRTFESLASIQYGQDSAKSDGEQPQDAIGTAHPGVGGLNVFKWSKSNTSPTASPFGSGMMQPGRGRRPGLSRRGAFNSPKTDQRQRSLTDMFPFKPKDSSK